MPPSPLNDLQSVFDVVANKFPVAGIECLLVGGFAVNHYGYSRSTLDIDFMILSDNRDVVRDAMVQAGFTSYSIHTNVTFFQRPKETLRIDFLDTDAETMAKLMSRAVRAEFYGVCVRLPALRDLLAMKFFSLSQNLARRMGKDLPDIVHLAIHNGLDAERDIHPLAVRFASEDVFKLVATQMKALQS